MPKQLYIPLPCALARRDLILRELRPRGAIEVKSALSEAGVLTICAVVMPAARWCLYLCGLLAVHSKPYSVDCPLCSYGAITEQEEPLSRKTATCIAVLCIHVCSRHIMSMLTPGSPSRRQVTRAESSNNNHPLQLQQVVGVNWHSLSFGGRAVCLIDCLPICLLCGCLQTWTR